MSKLIKLSACLLMIGTGAALAAGKAKVVEQVRVTDEFQETELEWLGRPRPGFVLRWRTKVIDGEIAICGAAAFPEIQLRSASRNVLRRSYIVYEDKKIMRDMTFFNRVKRESKLDGSLANCASTGIKAPKGGYSVNLGWASGSSKG